MSWMMTDALLPLIMIVQVAMARGVQQRMVAVVSQVITIIISQPAFSLFSRFFNIDIYRWRVLTKKKPLPGFSLMISVWMSQQKLVHCVVCNCTSINLSSCKKDLAVQRGGKISRGYFHFLNGTFNFQLIFKMFYLSKKNFRPKRFSVIFKLKWTMLLSTWPS